MKGRWVTGSLFTGHTPLGETALPSVTHGLWAGQLNLALSVDSNRRVAIVASQCGKVLSTGCYALFLSLGFRVRV